jgi:hypothetical protein
MSHRPPLLTVLCVLGLMGCFINMMMVLSPPVRDMAPWFPTYLSLSTLCSAIFLGGLWFLKRWALWGYSLFFISNQVVYLSLHQWNGYALVLPLAVTLTAWAYSRKMN